MNLWQMLSTYFFITEFRDIAEIFIISYVLYKVALWIRADQTKILLLPFYSLGIVCTISWIIPFPTILSFVLWCTPIIGAFIIVFHQKTIQKNIISVKQFNAIKEASQPWTLLMGKFLLQAHIMNKELWLIIEKQDLIDSFLCSNVSLESKLTEPLIEMILTFKAFNQSKFVIINKYGFLKGFNAEWIQIPDTQWLEGDYQSFNHSLQQAIAFTGHTDTIFCINQKHDTSVTMIMGGTLIKDIPYHRIELLLSHCLYKPMKEKGINHYESPTQKCYTKQNHY